MCLIRISFTKTRQTASLDINIGAARQVNFEILYSSNNNSSLNYSPFTANMVIIYLNYSYYMQ